MIQVTPQKSALSNYLSAFRPVNKRLENNESSLKKPKTMTYSLVFNLLHWLFSFSVFNDIESNEIRSYTPIICAR